jgi:hypothetical protein
MLLSNLILNLRLHPKQGIAFQSNATEILYGGACGGGKSHLLRVAAIAWCFDIPGLQVYLFRRIFPDLIKNHMEGPTSFPALLLPWVGSKHVKINYSDNDIQFWNGSKIFLCHCQYEKDVEKYQGPEIHVLMIDELTHFLGSMYRYLRGRVRLGGLKIPEKYKPMFPRILSASNPGSIGHNWVKAAFIDPVKPLEMWTTGKGEGGMMRQFIPARLEDNPTLTEADPKYSERLEAYGDPALVRAMLSGDWDIVAGGAFDDIWNPDIHVIPYFEPPQSWYVDRSFDWGSSHPFSVGWWAESDGTQAPNGKHYPRGTLFRIAEYYGWNGQPNEGNHMNAAEIGRKVVEIEKGFKFHVKPGPADTQIFDSDVSFAADMERVGCRWTRADKSPLSRKTGFEKMRAALKASTAKPLEEPGLFIMDTCRQFIRTVPVLPRSKTDPDDVEKDSEDHVYDEARYRLFTIRPQLFQVRLSEH